MTEKINKINNPLTIIAIFAALAEINATIAIALIDKSLHHIFIWFIILFPTILVISFFLTLNFNTKVMYSPSDYKEDKSFMDSLFGNNYGEKNETKLSSELSKLSSDLEQKINDKVIEKFKTMNLESDKLTKKDIEKLKSDIKQATDESIKEIRDESILERSLKERMLLFLPYPAYYVLISAIIQSNAKSVKDIKKFSEEFYIPESWQRGAFPRLLQDKILIGNRESFVINKDYKNDLVKWHEANEPLLKYFSEQFKKISVAESLGEKEKFRNKVGNLAAKIKF